MTRFSAIFAKMDGLEDVDVGNHYGLSAETIDAAETEALALPAPAGANFVKILDEGRVVRRRGFAL